MSTFITKMLMDMDLRGLSLNTKSAYRLHVKHFSEHFGKPPEQMGETEIREYLHHGIAVRKLSSSYTIVCYAALKFFFANTLGREWDNKTLPRIKRRKKLPNILSKEEILLLLDATNNIKHRAVLMTAYGAGLRVSELANLKIADIDSNNMQIFIRQGKGQVDRFSILSVANLAVLRKYYKQYHLKVWLFPGQDPTNAITTHSLQLIFRYAKRKVGIEKEVFIHSLRHSFATHLLEDGVDICHIQKLLGHKNVSTTCKYLHLTRLSLLNVKSPLDTMPELTDD
ncbi:MAG: tyrosine-type recombinase/integrase [Negativicutes bacterium]